MPSNDSVTNTNSNDTRPPNWLAKRRVWLNWALEPSDNPRKPRKMPYWANGVKRHGELGSKKDEDHLVTYDTAVKAAAKFKRRVGLAIVGDLAFVDLDDCLKAGEPSTFAQEVSELCPHALVEVSQSGNGLHILGVTGREQKVSVNRKALGFEAYTFGRFCAWTGNIVSWHEEPCDLDPVLDKLLVQADADARNVVEFNPSTERSRALYTDTLADAGRLLDRIPNDREGVDWDTYSHVLCALRNTFPDEAPAAFAIFDAWAQQSDKYDERTTRKDWKSFRPKTSGKKFTMATLVHLATSPPPIEPTPEQPDVTNEEDPYRFAGDISELLDIKLPPIKWVVEGMIPPGLVIFAGPPKTGKSRVLMQLALSIASGTPFLNAAVRKGYVLMLSLEDPISLSQSRLRGTMAQLKLQKSDVAGQLYWKVEWDQGQAAVDRVREALELQKQEGHTPRLVIIDTLQRVRDAKEQRKTQYEIDYEGVKPWAELRRDWPDTLFVLVHHTRKSESEDAFDMISGTQGLFGAVDGAFVLRRPGKAVLGSETLGEEAKDKLLLYGRNRYYHHGDLEVVLQSEQDLVAVTELKPWELVGSGKQIEILKTMETDKDKVWTSTELQLLIDGEADKRRVTTIRTHLKRMKDKGKIFSLDGVGYRVTPAGKY